MQALQSCYCQRIAGRVCISTGNFAEWQSNKKTDSEKCIVRDPFALRVPKFLCCFLLNLERALGLDPKGSHLKKRKKNKDREVIVPRGIKNEQLLWLPELGQLLSTVSHRWSRGSRRLTIPIELLFTDRFCVFCVGESCISVGHPIMVPSASNGHFKNPWSYRWPWSVDHKTNKQTNKWQECRKEICRECGDWSGLGGS